MNKKFSVRELILIIFLAVFLTASVSLVIVNRQYSSLLSDVPQKLEKFQIIDEVDELLDKKYYKNVEKKQLSSSLIAGYVNNVDEYSRYLTAEDYKKYQLQNDGLVSSSGIEYKIHQTNFEVTKVYPSSPAFKGGVKVGDKIIASDGLLITKSNASVIDEKIKTDKTDNINLTFKRNKKEFTLTLDKSYDIVPFSYQTFDKIGYIDINEFFSNTAGQVGNVVDRFLMSSINGIILDLRDNSSVNYENAVSLLDVFVPLNDQNNPACQFVDKDGEVLKTLTTTPGEVNIPIVVLINENTKMAGELFALDLRSFNKAQIVGMKSAGANVVTSPFELSDGNFVILPTGSVFAYNSENYGENGIVPDSEISKSSTSTDLSKDEQFKGAMSVIRDMTKGN